MSSLPLWKLYHYEQIFLADCWWWTHVAYPDVSVALNNTSKYLLKSKKCVLPEKVAFLPFGLYRSSVKTRVFAVLLCTFIITTISGYHSRNVEHNGCWKLHFDPDHPSVPHAGRAILCSLAPEKKEKSRHPSLFSGAARRESEAKGYLCCSSCRALPNWFSF